MKISTKAIAKAGIMIGIKLVGVINNPNIKNIPI